MTRSVRPAACLALLVMVAACGGSDDAGTPVGPSPPANSLSGTWSGVLTGLTAAQADGQLVVTVDHRRVDDQRGLLFGTWRLAAPDGAVRIGTISGSVEGSRVEIQLSAGARRECSPPVLPFALLVDGFLLTVTTGGAQLTGTVIAYSCTAAIEAPVVLAR